MSRKNPSLRLIVVMTAFLVMACTGSLPFAQEESPAAGQEGLIPKVTPDDLLSSRGGGLFNLAHNDIEVTYTDSTGQERTAYVDKSDIIYTGEEQTVTTPKGLNAKVNPDDLLSSRGGGILTFVNGIEVTYTDSTGREKTAYVDKSNIAYTEREQIVITSEKGLTAKVNPNDLLSSRGEGIFNLAYDDMELTYTDSTGQERTAYVDKSDIVYAEREQMVITLGGLTARVSPDDLLSSRGEGILNLAYNDIRIAYTGSTGQERMAYVDKSEIVYTEREQIVTTSEGLTAKANLDDLLSSRGGGLFNLAHNDIEVTYTDSTGQERTAYVDRSDIIYTEREQVVTTPKGLNAKVNPDDLLPSQGEGVLNLAYDDIEVTYTDSTGQERMAYVDKSDTVYTEREQIVTIPGSLTISGLTEEQIVCPIDQSVYTVLRDEESGCYLPISAKAPRPPDWESITIYTVLSEEQVACYLPIFERKHPKIQVKWCRGATWELTDKILVEKSDPYVDVIWGLAATAVLRIQAEGMLEPYAPAGLERINPRMRDTRADPPHWIGHDVWMSAFCVNTVEIEKLGLPMPTSWGDLLDPAYKGYLVMPNPNSSGTGFLSVSAWLQLLIGKDERATDLLKWADEKGMEGEEAAWAYMNALHENIILYTDSGSKPCKLAAAGKIPIGISFGSEAIEQRDLGHPIVAVFPEEGSGWEVETIALVRKPEVKPAAKTFMDWAISDSAMEAYAFFYPVTSVQTDAPLPEGYVTEPTKQLIKNRFLWATANRDRVMAEWLKRYENKTESGADVPAGFE